MQQAGRSVGTIYDDITSTGFTIAVSDPTLRRLDYVEADHQGRRVLGQVERVERASSLSHEQALAAVEDEAGVGSDDKLSAYIRVIGFLDERNRVQVPRTPFASGQGVIAATDDLVTSLLGLHGPAEGGAFLGLVKGDRIPVHLDLNVLAQKHVGVLAKTGAGKSYTVGVLLEEFLKAGVPMVILDPHGEYGSLRNANVDDGELEAMVRFGIKPKSFNKQVKEFALDTALNPDAERLVLEGLNLEAREIVDLLPAKLSGAQVGVLYQAVKEVKEAIPAYTIKDVMDAVARNKAASKWNVLNALEALDATGVFDIRGTPLPKLVQDGQCTIVNLKGVAPDIQEVVVTRLTQTLWEARKRNDAPPHILVVEEAHNFCPERGIGNATSGAIIRTVASEGRKFGLGLVIISQRPAKIDKNVLSQCNTQIILKVTNPNDLKAIVSSIEGITGDTSDEVQRLPVGSALVAGGGLTQPVVVDIRPRHTSHGGRSIKVVSSANGKATPTPPRAASVARPAPPSRAAAATRPPSPLARASAEDAPMPTPPRTAMPSAPPAPAPSRPAAQPVEAAGDTSAPEAAARTPTDDISGVTSSAHLTRAEIARKRAEAQRALEKPGAQRQAPAGKKPPVRKDLIGLLDPEKPSAWATTRPDAPRPPPPPPQPRRITRLTKAQTEGLHRVVRRVGIVGGDDPARSVTVVRNIAIQNDRDPDVRIGEYVTIAETVCAEAAPRCIQCPLREHCQFHARMKAEREKERKNGRSIIRRLWNR